MTEIQRRTFLRQGIAGLGLLGLNSLLEPRLFAAAGESHGVINPLHHPAKAKRIIFLYQAGGPSHLETFDNKPKLREMHSKPMPESFTKGQQIAQLQGKQLVCFGPQHEFKKFGKSGQEICELFPRIGGVADDICIVRSLWTEQINHDPAHTIMNTGSIIPGRPSMGWARIPKIYPASWCCSPRAAAAKTSRLPRGSGRRACCPANSRG